MWSSVLLHRVVVLCHLSTHPMLQNQKTHSSLTAQSAMLAPSAAVPPPPFSHPLLSVFLLHLQAALEPQPTCPPHIKKLTLPCSPLPPRDDQNPTASEAPLNSALVLLYKVLIYKPVLLLRFLEGEQQYRHLFVLVQTLMKDELDGVEGLTPAEKRDLKVSASPRLQANEWSGCLDNIGSLASLWMCYGCAAHSGALLHQRGPARSGRGPAGGRGAL